MVGGSFLVPYCLALLLPFLLGPKLGATRGRFVFLLRLIFIRDTFKLNFYFVGVRLYYGMECFLEPVEVTVLPVKTFEDS